MSGVGDFLHVLATGEQDVFGMPTMTGRKSWKTIKGKSEAVWPFHLEKALFEGIYFFHLAFGAVTEIKQA